MSRQLVGSITAAQRVGRLTAAPAAADAAPWPRVGSPAAAPAGPLRHARARELGPGRDTATVSDRPRAGAAPEPPPPPSLARRQGINWFVFYIDGNGPALPCDRAACPTSLCADGGYRLQQGSTFLC